MKVYLCILGILSTVVLVQCEIDPKLKAIVDECRKEFELTEEALKSPDFENPKVHCFAACVLEKDGRLTEGKVSIDKEVEAASRYIPERIDETLKDKMTECVNKANEETGECAVSGALFKCIVDTFGTLHPETS